MNTTTSMKIITAEEAAELLQVCKRTVIRMIQSKQLPGAFKVGGQWRVNENELVKWVEARSPLLVKEEPRDL